MKLKELRKLIDKYQHVRIFNDEYRMLYSSYNDGDDITEYDECSIERLDVSFDRALMIILK